MQLDGSSCPLCSPFGGDPLQILCLADLSNSFTLSISTSFRWGNILNKSTLKHGITEDVVKFAGARLVLGVCCPC